MEVFLAAGISLIVEFVKRISETTHVGTLALLFAASFFGAAVYNVLTATGLWTAFYHLVVEAAGIYALLVQYWPKSPDSVE